MGPLTSIAAPPWRRSTVETISAELLPLADAFRFLEVEAPHLLAPRNLGRRGRPFWLGGSNVTVTREPYGVVLILGPANYPLLLPGVQVVQALVAGNAVVLKPGRSGRAGAEALATILRDAGLPTSLFTVLDESVASARRLLQAGVDKVVLTGSADTGRDVLAQLATQPVPSVMELSGCDASFVRSDADVDLAARALVFGMTLNGGFTCIAPRRVFVAREIADRLERTVVELLASTEPLRVPESSAQRSTWVIEDAVRRGARIATGAAPTGDQMEPVVLADVPPDAAVMRADVAAPILAMVATDGDDHALALAEGCNYRLGASVFGAPSSARSLARRIDAGIVVINDMIVPTADPRVPFGGRGESGFGVTRGAEGLLEMTQVKTTIRRRGRFRPHLEPTGLREEALLPAFLRIAHSRTIAQRLGAALEIVKAMFKRGAA
jgi:acyl-CoA reductase-like NAD-dependent aldehyde dehydrogenase